MTHVLDATTPWDQLMRRGDFAAAWQVSDRVLQARARQECWHLPRHEQWVWKGGSPVGKSVLVRCYHGLGDTIQFARYLPFVREQARSLVVWAQPALVDLLRGVKGADHVLPLHDGNVGVSYEVDLEIMELPHLFRSTLGTLPAQVPYLHAPASCMPPRLLPADACHVGVVWQAGDWDEARSVPLKLVASLARLPGIVLHALQRGPALAQWDTDLGPISGSDDVSTTAGMMNALDLIISVDSFPAHLAGALGGPVWTLLHSDPDWRWLQAREDSPWYPTMRLFRQERPGDWEPVIARVAAELPRITSPPREL